MSPPFPSQVGCPRASLPAILWAEPFPPPSCRPWGAPGKRGLTPGHLLCTPASPSGRWQELQCPQWMLRGPRAPVVLGRHGEEAAPLHRGRRKISHHRHTSPQAEATVVPAPPEDERCGWYLGLVLPCKPGAGARAEKSGPVGCGISGASCFLLQEALVQTEGPWTPSQDCSSREGRVCLAGRSEGWPGCSLAAVWTSLWWRPCGQFPWRFLFRAWNKHLRG